MTKKYANEAHFRYEVIDQYDYFETILETNNLDEAYAAVLQRMADTDGECDCFIRDYQTAPFPGGSTVFVELYGEEDED